MKKFAIVRDHNIRRYLTGYLSIISWNGNRDKAMVFTDEIEAERIAKNILSKFGAKVVEWKER